MSKRAFSSTRRFFLKASSVGGAVSAVAMSGLGSLLEACTTGTGGTGCSYGYGYGYGLGYGGGYGYGYGCIERPAGGGYGYGGGIPYGYGYGGGIPYGYGYGGGIPYGYGNYGGYGYGMAAPSHAEEQDTALRLGLAPERVGPAHRIRV